MYKKILKNIKKDYGDFIVFHNFILGLASGITLLLSGNSLNFWLSQEKIDKVTIGLFSIVALPYALKFLLSPFIDLFSPPFLGKLFGKKRSWVIISQSFLIITIILLGNTSPKTHLEQFAILGFLVAFFSVMQDITLDSYRVEILQNKNKGPATATYIFGYRVGMLISGAFAIYLSSSFEWSVIYNLMGLLIFLIMLFISFNYLGEDKQTKIKYNLQTILVKPFKHIGNLKQIGIILLFLLLYRIADNLIMTMINPFLLEHNYSSLEISYAGKLFGFIGVIIGGIISGSIINKLSLRKSLLFFGLAHSLGSLLYFPIIIYGKSMLIFYILTAIESITGGMAMTAYIAFMTNLCKGNSLATQYASLSSIMGISRVIIPSISGLLVENYGWYNFFVICFLLSLTSLLLINFIKKSNL